MGLLDALIDGYKRGAGLLAPNQSDVDMRANIPGLLADFTPVLGDAKSVYDGVQSARQGDWLGAGMGALGALPFVPAMGGMVKGADILKQYPDLAGTAVQAGGVPKMVHHGSMSNEPIVKFNRRHKPDVAKGKDSIDSIGTWFTDNPARVTDYGVADYPSYLGMKNPMVLDSFDDLRDIWNDVQKSRGNKLKSMHKQNPHLGDSDLFVQQAIGDGFDGVVIKKHGAGEWNDQNAYIVFDPSKIKSAISP